jgi:hypothetical protein
LADGTLVATPEPPDEQMVPSLLALPAHLFPDPAAVAGRADHRPAGVAGRPRCPPNPQGQARQANEFGYVVQLAEVTANTRRGARG